MRGGRRYTEQDLFQACEKVRAKYTALTPQQRQGRHFPCCGEGQQLTGGTGGDEALFNASLVVGSGTLPVPWGQLDFVCSLVAKYHNELTGV